MRRRKRDKDSLEFDVESIPCATQTDSYSGARQMIREDGTLGVWYREGATFTIHKDGTRICTRAENIIVEKDGYAPVRIWGSVASDGNFNTQFAPTVTKDEERTPEEDQYSGASLDIRERAIDGRIIETLFPD